MGASSIQLAVLGDGKNCHEKKGPANNRRIRGEGKTYASSRKPTPSDIITENLEKRDVGQITDALPSSMRGSGLPRKWEERRR